MYSSTALITSCFTKLTTLKSLSPKLNKKEHSKILLKAFEFSIKKEMELLWVLRRVFEDVLPMLVLVAHKLWVSDWLRLISSIWKSYKDSSCFSNTWRETDCWGSRNYFRRCWRFKWPNSLWRELGISEHYYQLFQGELDFSLLIPGIDFIKQLMAEKE